MRLERLQMTNNDNNNNKDDNNDKWVPTNRSHLMYPRGTCFFKRAQPQIGSILITLRSTAPASDLVVDIKIYQNLQFLHEVFPKSQKNNTQMIFSLWVICTDWVNDTEKYLIYYFAYKYPWTYLSTGLSSKHAWGSESALRWARPGWAEKGGCS